MVAGGVDFGERTNDRLPFDSLILAGVALAIVVAAPLTVLAWSAWTGAARTDDLALLVGVMLIGWIAVQVIMLRAFSPFQPAYLCVGVGFVAASKRVRLGARWRGVLFVGVGSVLVAIGVGLAPHVIKNGLTTMSVVSIVAALTGLRLVVDGARSALRGRRWLAVVGGTAAVMIAIGLAVSTIAPAVAVYNVPTTHVDSTPAAVGLDFESVTLTTDDGVELAGWYVEGTNRAGLVVLHGAGSTRSDVLDQAAALVRSGFGVVLIDARGHGDSGGAAMDFGWHGDLDIAAATRFLAARPEVDPGLIGVVGFSMGGEEAIGAAATDPLIHAVVAEGATGRRASDKEWLSDVYGWRGWLQERLEYVQEGVTGYLANASPPITLRSAVAGAQNTRFLLITADDADEGHAARFIQSASERVTVWTVNGADHTGGYGARPDEWQQRVTDFLDDSLGSSR